MSWRRGFYRLWIVATVVWFAGVIFILRPDAAAVDYFGRARNSAAEDAKIVAEFNALHAPFTDSEEEQAVITKYNNQLITKEYLNRDCGIVKGAILIGIIPSLGLLVIGEFVGWAMRGFRARSL